MWFSQRASRGIGSWESIERFLRVGAEMLLSGMAEAPATAHFEQRLVEALRQPGGRSAEAPASLVMA